MMMKQRYYTTRTLDPVTREWITYRIPMPEYVPDYSGVVIRTLPVMVLIGACFLRIGGIM